MSREWKIGQKQRKYIKLSTELVWIKSGDPDEHSVPFECPLCNVLLRDRQDSLAYDYYQCCSECSAEVAHPNKVRWENGWRPNENELKSIRKKRIELPSYIGKL